MRLRRPAELTVRERRPGRFAGETRVTLSTPRGGCAHGLWFAGRPADGLRPWADLADADLGVLGPIARALGPGGAIMVAYRRMERALRAELRAFLADGAADVDRARAQQALLILGSRR
jgi:hypothetical protein